MRSILIFIVSLSFLSFHKDNFIPNPTDLGEKIFATIKSQNRKEFAKLIATKKQIMSRIDEADEDSTRLAEFKTQFGAKLDQDKEITRENLFNEFDKIIKEINNNNCKKTIQLGKIAPDINKLRQLPVELGELDFEIECKELKKTVSVKIIYTSVGWRILEKLRTKKH
jgi:hypothetical protein